MHRRTFLQCGLGSVLATPLLAALKQDKLAAAEKILAVATDNGQLHAAALCVQQGDILIAKAFGAAQSTDDIFLLASISKPMSVAAVMTLFDQGAFRLDDPVKKFIPEFARERREAITISHLLTHVSVLPDQLPENNDLRRRHAKLSEFVELAVRTPLLFEPGSKYSYSSMGILLAAEVAQRITHVEFSQFMDKAVFQPLAMKRTALGLGPFKIEETMRCQVERAAPEAGGGDPAAKDWDWNSAFWRNLGSPWGGVHGSAPDTVRFLAEFLHPTGKTLKAETARSSEITIPRESRRAGWALPSAPKPAVPVAPNKPSAIPAPRARSPGPIRPPTPSALCSPPFPNAPRLATPAASPPTSSPRRWHRQLSDTVQRVKGASPRLCGGIILHWGPPPG
jgi:beta-lactamase class C